MEGGNITRNKKFFTICVILISLIAYTYILLKINIFIAISIPIVLLMTYFIYMIYIADKDKSPENNVPEVNEKQIINSVKILRYAAASLSVISWITTAEGLKQFVFTHLWQAYVTSFAVQSTLLVFSLMFINFYFKMKNIENLKVRFRRLLVYSMIIFYIITLAFSSTFSYVFIANNVYADVRLKDNNITIDKFLKKESYTLRNVNNAIGKILKQNLNDNIAAIFQTIYVSDDVINDEAVNIISDYLSKSNLVIFKGKRKSFITQDEVNGLLDDNDQHKSELYRIKTDFDEFEARFDECYNKYLNEFEIFNGLNNNHNFGMYKKGDFTNCSQDVDVMEKSLPSNEDIDRIESYFYRRDIQVYRDRTKLAFSQLRGALTELKTTFSQLGIEYDAYESFISTKKAAVNDVNKMLALINSDSPSVSELGSLNSSIVDRCDSLLKNNEIDSEQVKKLSKFVGYLQDYNKYSILKANLDEFIDRKISLTYLILPNKDESEMTSTDTVTITGGAFKVFNEIEWIKERKSHFIEFNSYLKSLPDTGNEIYSYKGMNTQADLASVYKIVEEYDVNKVLDKSYNLNRDLLEDITGFEKAVNYFKYDFKMMAIFSLLIALFLDIGAFLIGCFLFSAGFFGHNSTKLDNNNAITHLD
jgi:hypothetical protein